MSHAAPGDANLWVERYTLSRHSDWVRACAFSPDGKTVLSGSKDNTLKLWNVGTGKEKYTLMGHSGAINCCAFSPETDMDHDGGQFIVSASDDNTLKIWYAASGTDKCTLSGHSGSVHACTFSPDGKIVLSCSEDKTLKLWDVGTGKAKDLSGHSYPVTSCAFSPDGQSVLSCSHDYTLKLWDVGSGKVKYTLKGHTGWVFSCAFSPDGQTVLSGSDDKTLKLWDLGTGEAKYTLSGHSKFEQNFKTWSDCVDEKTFEYEGQPYRKTVVDGRHVVLLGMEVVWRDLCKYTLRGHSGSVFSCAFSPDGKSVLSGSGDKTLKLWDLGTGEAKYTLSGQLDFEKNFFESWPETKQHWDPKGFLQWENEKTFDHEGQKYRKTVVDGRHVVLLGGEVVWRDLCKYTLSGHSHHVACCAFASDGKTVVSASEDNTLKLWSVQERAAYDIYDICQNPQQREGTFIAKNFRKLVQVHLRSVVNLMFNLALDDCGGVDEYTGLTTAELHRLNNDYQCALEVLGPAAVNHGASVARPPDKLGKTKVLWDVDHVWEVQLWGTAVATANSRVNAEGDLLPGISLAQSLYLRDEVINVSANLVCTLWSVNVTAKAVLVKKFLEKWSFTRDPPTLHSVVSAANILKIGHPKSKMTAILTNPFELPGREPLRIIDTIEGAMRRVLEAHVRPALLEPKGNWRPWELLYFASLFAVLSHMLKCMFPDPPV